MPVYRSTQKVSDAALLNPVRPWPKMIRCDTASGEFDVINKCLASNPHDKVIFAEGDSWFDKFTPLPLSGTNLLQEIRLPFSTVVVDVSKVGDESGDMVKGLQAWRTEALFRYAMQGYDAILLSAGGNDLKNLYAEKVRKYSEGGITPSEISKMRRPSEYGDFFDGVVQNIIKFVEFRDKSKNPKTKNAPIILHGYDYFQPRPAKASIFSGSRWGTGPWIYPVLKSVGFNSDEMRSAADAVVDQFNLMLAEKIAQLENVHVIDSRGILNPAAAGSTGASEHWLDEIHPSSAGFEKLARCCWNKPLAELMKFKINDADLDDACLPATVSTALAEPGPLTPVVA